MPAENQADIDNLKAARSAAIVELAAIQAKVSYSIDGQSVEWDPHAERLEKSIENYNRLIQQLEGPIWVTSYGRG